LPQLPAGVLAIERTSDDEARRQAPTSEFLLSGTLLSPTRTSFLLASRVTVVGTNKFDENNQVGRYTCTPPPWAEAQHPGASPESNTR